MRVKSLTIGDTLTAGVSSDDLSKPICGCARTIAAAAEQLLLTHAHAPIARGFAGLLDAAPRETSCNDPQGAFWIVVYVALDCFDLRAGIRYRVGTPS
jgi:hypothetical protein